MRCGITAARGSDHPPSTLILSHISYYLYRSPVFPIAFSILIGFVVAQIFFAVYEMAIDTILLAFCEDCELHGGNPKWAPPLLMEAMGVDDSKPAPPLAVKGNAVAPGPA